MLVGEDCSVPLNITEAIFDEAHRRLLNMPFVGKCKCEGGALPVIMSVIDPREPRDYRDYNLLVPGTT